MRYCLDCGKQITHSAFRCKPCSYRARWQLGASASAGRKRAGHRFSLGPCQSCGQPATDRHHIDGNTFNNAPENVAKLCRRCHMIADGRAESFPQRARDRRIYPDYKANRRAYYARRKLQGRPTGMVPCPLCGQLKARAAKRCRACYFKERRA